MGDPADRVALEDEVSDNLPGDGTEGNPIQNRGAGQGSLLSPGDAEAAVERHPNICRAASIAVVSQLGLQ